MAIALKKPATRSSNSVDRIDWSCVQMLVGSRSGPVMVPAVDAVAIDVVTVCAEGGIPVMVDIESPTPQMLVAAARDIRMEMERRNDKAR